MSRPSDRRAENGFAQNEGIANERAAQFYLARGYDTGGYAYLRNARSCYLRWGALGKVRQLDQLYPQPARGTNACFFHRHHRHPR